MSSFYNLKTLNKTIVKGFFIMFYTCSLFGIANADSKLDQLININKGVGQAGVTVLIDPQSGEKITPVLPEHSKAVQQALESAANRTTKGLVEQSVPGKGVLVDLRGRFQSALTVQVASDGRKVIGHPAHTGN